MNENLQTSNFPLHLAIVVGFIMAAMVYDYVKKMRKEHREYKRKNPLPFNYTKYNRRGELIEN